MDTQSTVADTKRQLIEALVAKKDYRAAVVECEELEILVRMLLAVMLFRFVLRVHYTERTLQEAPALVVGRLMVQFYVFLALKSFPGVHIGFAR